MSTYWPFKSANPYDNLFQEYGNQYGVDPILLRLIAQRESSYNPRATSPKGARGLFQVMPETAKGMGFDPANLHDPRVSAEAGTRYLKEQLDRHNGDIRLALASYNAGPGNVRKYGGIPPFNETQKYVTIADEYERLLAGKPTAQISAAPLSGGKEAAERFLASIGSPQKAIGSESGKAERIIQFLESRAKSQAQPQQEVATDPNAYYNPYPKGSKEWADEVVKQGGQMAIRPTQHLEGAMLPGGKMIEEGRWEPWDSTYQSQWKARVDQVIDADTVWVREMGTGERKKIRLPDVNAAESSGPDATPEGIAARNFVANMLQPGDQLTIEGKTGEWVGKYGRPLGKIYWTDDNGQTIDLSTPFVRENADQVIKGSDPMAPEGETGFWGATVASLGQDAIEIAQSPQTILDLIDLIDGEEDYDPMKESAYYQKLEGYRQFLKEKQASYVADGYDPDAKTYDIPLVGNVTPDELVKAGLTSSIYTVGIFPLLGAMSKSIKGFTLAAKARQGYRAAMMASEEAAKYANRYDRVTKYLKKTLGESHEMYEATEKYARETKRLLDETAEVMHTMVDIKPNMSAVERLRLYKDLFLQAWSSKTASMERVAKATGRLDELRHLQNQINAAADVSNSPVVDGVLLWDKVDGKEMPAKVSESLLEIWSGTEAIDMHLGMSWSVGDRVRELWNSQERLITAAMSEIQIGRVKPLKDWPKGKPRPWGADSLPYVAKAAKQSDKASPNQIKRARETAKELAEMRAKKEGRRWVDLDEEDVKQHIARAQRIEKLYKELPIKDRAGNIIGNHWDGVIENTPTGPVGRGGLKEMIERTRAWSVKATLDVVENVGAITAAEKALILAKNEHHAPFNRANLGYLRDILPEETIQQIIYTENEMLMHATQHASLMGRGLSERSVMGVPLGRLKKSIKPGEAKDLIVDPAQTYLTRTVAVNKWANQQRVRNMMGEMLDELIKDESKGSMHKWAKKTVQRITDETEEGKRIVEQLKKSGSMAAGFIRYTKNAKGKKVTVAYLTHDPALADALSHLDPSHMALFKSMTQSPLTRALMKPTDIFRKGTVLGLHFMARNPMRDQFMAATLTKYGYIPVVDWWRGLFHVVSKSPLYENMRMGGGTQATHTAASFAEMQRTHVDVQTGETLTQNIRRRILGPDNNPHRSVEAMDTPFFDKRPGVLKSIANSWIGTKNNAQTTGNVVGDGFKLAGYGLRRISETFEEATRMGAYAKAVKRAKKGKKYTFFRALDEAMGGSSGFYKMLTSSEHRAGFMTRFKNAAYYTPNQMQKMRGTGMWLDADMIDEIRNITLDFQRRGKYGEVFNAFYPFFNAELQDVARFGRAFSEAPMTTMLRGFTFVTVPAVANWYLNFDNPQYHQLTEVERELFIHPFGYNPEYKKFQRLSRPLGSISGFFGLLPHRFLDWLAANDPAAIKVIEEMFWPGKSARQARNGFIESLHETSSDLEDAIPGWARGLAFGAAMGTIPMAATGELGERVDNGNPKYRDVPLGQYGMANFGDYISTNTALRYIKPRKPGLKPFVTSVMPQVAAPFVQALANYDPYFDRAIASPSDLANPRLPEDMADELSSPLEVALARGLNKVFRLQLTPQQASHLYRRYTSSIGTMAMAGINKFGEEHGLFPKRPGVAEDFSEKFLAKAFHSREPIGSNSDAVRTLYDTWEQDKLVLASMDWAQKNGKPVRLMEIVRDHPEALPAMLLQEAVGDMGEFYDMRDMIRVEPAFSDEERSDYLFQIDQALTTYAFHMMQAYWNIRRNPQLAFDLLGDD